MKFSYRTSKRKLPGLCKAEAADAATFGLLGRDGGKMKGQREDAVVVSSQDTTCILVTHIMIGHVLCDAVELQMA